MLPTAENPRLTGSVQSQLALLSCAEMGRADAAAGVAGVQLMEAAGRAVAQEVVNRFGPRPTVVACGRGNNGGDGFVAARFLAAAGWPVRIALLPGTALTPDAAHHAARWSGPVEPLSVASLAGAELVVDALFGAGLTRPLDGVTRAVVEAINDRKLACVAVDLPSGVSGDSGAVLGAAPRCQASVTFFRAKPGHWLLPGRALCGETVVADIGIPSAVLDAIAPQAWRNAPALWQAEFPWPQPEGHKYARGHALIVGGERMTGAARLAARAAMRVGAGLVTVASAPAALPLYAADTAALLTAPLTTAHDFARLLADARRNAVLLGPGNGVDMTTQQRVLAALAARKACVLDADALSIFADDPGQLFGSIRGPCVMTPHEGEFARLFPDAGPDKLSRARRAAALSGAVVLLKGFDTVIAAPDGRAVINTNAPPDLATAGAGDVLSGLCVGLLAQGVEPFATAAMAAWLHGEAAIAAGPGLIADDLPVALPAVLRRLKSTTA